MQTIRVYPNPYHVLDARSQLAGACREGEEVRAGEAMPLDRYVGAVREVLQYEPQRSATQQSRTQLRFIFDTQAHVVPFEREMQAYYVARIRCGEIFQIVGEGQVKAWEKGKETKVSLLEALAKARLKAFDDYAAAYGSEPDTSSWAAQFAPDAEVAETMKKLVDARAAAPAPAAPAEPEKPEPFPLVPPTPSTEPTPTATPSTDPVATETPSEPPVDKGSTKAAKAAARS